MGPYSVGLGLAEFLISVPYCIQAELIFGQAPRHILVYPKVPTPCYYFLTMLFLQEGSKLTFKYVFTLQSPLKEIYGRAHHLQSNPSLDLHVYGMYMLGMTCGTGCAGYAKDGWKETSSSCSWSELILSSWLLRTSGPSGDSEVLSQTVALGMLVF